ncbi:NAD(P)/FAD-dependent oxidoreductase [Halobacillus sp. Nhm2S1]|uniref:phytoene desaturase family protein n=1 Tax=Halobacillus sp. Nhm2S1 TaxID=2866716 RepID=UPI001C72E0F1|nr:FAD-dependent oxidoreductase [Halobacillus sp. Nhm2S1]MBX0357972.1 FAD-dependent oxidoreductase [Halobacillus sp. Nhm2S1]
MIYDVGVVGAGFGGLAAAASLAKKGMKVAVFEASNELGGSAGKFERNGYRFQSGATLGMGFEEGGVLRRLFDQLNIDPPAMTLLDTIMDIHMPDRTIHYFRERSRWYEEIQRVFPTQSSAIQAFYDEVYRVGAVVDQLTEDLPVFPPRTFKDFMHFVPLVKKEALKLLPFMNQTVEERLKKYDLHNHRLFRVFLNGELMDSVQTSVEYCPAFLGYAALQTFHKGAYAVHGGLAAVAERLASFIKDSGSDLYMRHPIHKVEKNGGHFEFHTKRDRVFRAQKVLLNNSVHNFHDTVSKDMGKQSYIKALKEEKRDSWGAFIIHGGVDGEVFEGEDAVYHQFIDPQKPDDLHDGGQFLMSLSDPQDSMMAPPGKRSLTISTHTSISPWWNSEQYEADKEHMKNRLLETVDFYFPSFKEKLDIVLPGTPITFQKWLRRKYGKVGGYTPTGKYSWLNSYSIRTGIPDVYQCGDTVFPGAGTLGVTLSGMTAAKEMMR